jgi:GTPase-associated protein 1, N-terminal domain type 2
MKITAAQHVSAMLTSKQSPRGEAGFQTLYYTQELLTPDDVSVIEQMAQYSSARDRRPKWQSYRLSPRRHAVTHIVPIRQRDDAGRGGRYFTHSYIFDLPGRERFDASLLSWLRPHRFHSSLKEVLASGGLKTGHAPNLQLELEGTSTDVALNRLCNWTGEELNRLYMLMSEPRRLIELGEYVALVGNDEQILEALAVAFLLAPASALASCSFDTNPSGGGASPPDGPFWGRGAAAAAGTSYVIDAARRQVVVPESSPLRGNGFSPEQLSAPLKKAVAARLSRPPEATLRRLLERQYEAFISELVYEALLRETDSPAEPSDFELLSSLGHAHRGLGLLLAVKSGDDAWRLRTLSGLNRSSYMEYARQLKSRPDFRPWHAFSPIFMSPWFELFRGEYGPDDLTAAVATVAAHGSKGDRKYVEDMYKHLDEDEQRALGDWLRASPFRFARLQTALDKPARVSADGDRAGRSRSLWCRILHPFLKWRGTRP